MGSRKTRERQREDRERERERKRERGREREREREQNKKKIMIMHLQGPESGTIEDHSPILLSPPPGSPSAVHGRSASFCETTPEVEERADGQKRPQPSSTQNGRS